MADCYPTFACKVISIQQYVAQYQNTILNANLDAENAMVGYLQSLDQTDHLQGSADAAVKLTNVSDPPV